MIELVTYLAKALVSDPDAVTVTETQNDETGTSLIEVRVAESDMGKIIGKQGRIAKAIRTLVKSASQKDGKTYSVSIESHEEQA